MKEDELFSITKIPSNQGTLLIFRDKLEREIERIFLRPDGTVGYRSLIFYVTSGEQTTKRGFTYLGDGSLVERREVTMENETVILDIIMDERGNIISCEP